MWQDATKKLKEKARALGGTFHNVEKLRQSLQELKRISNEDWIIQRHDYQNLAQIPREQSRALPLAA